MPPLVPASRLPGPRRRMPWRLAVVAMAVVAVACGGVDDTRSSTTTPNGSVGSVGSGDPASVAADRVEAITAARVAAEPVLTAASQASDTLAAMMDAWADAPDDVDLPTEVAMRRDGVQAAIDDLRGALDPLVGPQPASRDVVLADEAMEGVADVVQAQLDAAEAVAVVVELDASVDVITEDFVVVINGTGGRADQRAAMDGFIARVAPVREQAATSTAAAACPDAVAAALAALDQMVAVADELGTMAINRQGTAFDQLRDRATADPHATAAAPATVGDCAAVGLVSGGASGLATAVEDVTAALSPPDLLGQ